MKDRDKILSELKYREGIQEKIKSHYGRYRANKSIIETLKWVLNMPTSMKSH